MVLASLQFLFANTIVAQTDEYKSICKNRILRNNKIDTAYIKNKVLQQVNGEFRFWNNNDDNFMRMKLFDSNFYNYHITHNEDESPDSVVFYIDTTIKQNNSIFKIWRHDQYRDSGSFYEGGLLAIERITQKEDTVILFQSLARREEFKIRDINKDGFTDYYCQYMGMGHHYPLHLSLFNPTKNMFDIAIDIPDDDVYVLDPYQKLFITYEKIDSHTNTSSQLYTFKALNLICLFEISYILGNDDNVISIKLYKFNNGKRTFVKKLLYNPKIGFDSEKYWRTNYKQLLGYKLE